MSQQQPRPESTSDNADPPRPSQELDVYYQAISPTVSDPKPDANLGLGNYSDREYWQQVQSFKEGLYSHAAFGEQLVQRAIEETKRKLAREVWEADDPDSHPCQHVEALPDPDEYRSAQAFVREEREAVWRALAPAGADEEDELELRHNIIKSYAGMFARWTPPQWEMVKMRHEASRSIDSQLLDNLFGRVTVSEYRGDDDIANRLSPGNGGGGRGRR